MAATTETAAHSMERPCARAPETAPKDRGLVITRVFDAPRSLVFRAWTRPEHMVRWMGCEQTRDTTVTEHDLRPGGAWRIVMGLADGTDHVVRGVYREIAAPERLVFTWAAEDADGNPGHETLVTVTLAERGARTELTLHHAVFESTEVRDLHGEGWAASLDRLVAYLASARA